MAQEHSDDNDHIPLWLSVFKNNLLVCFESVRSELSEQYPNVIFSVGSGTWGQKTNAQGYNVYLSCVMPEQEPAIADLIDLEISISHIRTQPKLTADVCWGHPSGFVEQSFHPQAVVFDEQTKAQFMDGLPNLVDALKTALKRGKPLE